MEYVFNKGNETEGTIFIKELNNNIKILINTNKLNRINNDVSIKLKKLNDFTIKTNNLIT